MMRRLSWLIISEIGNLPVMNRDDTVTWDVCVNAIPPWPYPNIRQLVLPFLNILSSPGNMADAIAPECHPSQDATHLTHWDFLVSVSRDILARRHCCRFRQFVREK